MVKKLPCNVAHVRSIPSQGTKIPRASGQLDLCVAARESPQAPAKTQHGEQKKRKRNKQPDFRVLLPKRQHTSSRKNTETEGDWAPPPPSTVTATVLWWEGSGGPVVKTPSFHCRGARLQSLVKESKLPHATRQGQKVKKKKMQQLVESE